MKPEELIAMAKKVQEANRGSQLRKEKEHRVLTKALTSK